MKKDSISLLALMLAAAALVLAIVSVVRKPAADCNHTEEIAVLQSQLEALQSQLDSLQVQPPVTSVSGGRADLFINEWEQRDGTLTLTDGYIQVQLSGGASIDKTLLVMMHNGVEHSRAEITLEIGEAEGSYHCTLTDTWFILPELKDDDTLDVHLVVTLSNGDTVISGGTSYYATAEGLYAVVG